MKKLVLCINAMVLLCLFPLCAQTDTEQNLSSLDKYFTAYELTSLDLENQHQQLSDRSSFHQLKLSLPDYGKLKLDLTPTQIFSDDYFRKEFTDEGDIISGIPEIYTFKGRVDGINDSKVSLTITPRMMNGFVRIGADRYIIQSLRKFIPSASLNSLIIYNSQDSKEIHPAHCGTKNLTSAHIEEKHSHSSRSLDGECFEIEIALASDFEMFQDHGSANNVEDQIVGVLDDVQNNYDDEFADELLFEVATLQIATSNATDPWTNANGAGTLLNDFSSWGSGGGFGTGYDIATLWTDRNLSGSTVGIAWLSSVCGNFTKHNVCQDFTGNANSLRVLQAHELGHNFGAGHSSAGTIMAPSVNNTNSWSNQSINQIESFYNNINCLGSCPPSGPPAPVADFRYDQDEECSPVWVEFEDLSTGIVDDYFWEFEGGNPSTSTQANPTVLYENEGVFDVRLTVSNSGGSDIETKNNEIVILEGTTAGFDYDIDVIGNTVSFTNTSDPNVTSFDWDFDDFPGSNEENPVHFYDEDGFYFVELEVDNGECTDIYGIEIEIATAPEADFFSFVTEGCAPLVVDFNNRSSDNADDWEWEFEGGSPAFSDDYEPTVVYDEAGVYDVLLIVENEIGTHELLLENYITVYPETIADFDFFVEGPVVEFDNDSDNYDDVLWDFGDGNFSEENHPLHTYDEDGTYQVELTVTGDCGPVSFTQEIIITTQASASISLDVEGGCLPLSVEFDGSDSFLSDDFEWSFEGATPSSSTAQIVSVVYTEVGQYDVSLTVSNNHSEDVLIIENAVTVNDAPVADYVSSNDALEFSFEAIPDGTYNTSYSWDLGDGTEAEGMMVNHTFEQEGIYVVEMTATNECGSTSISTNYNTYTFPVSNFMLDEREGCLPHSIQFSSLASDNTEVHAWLFPGGSPSASNEINPIVSYDEAGTYTVSLEVSNPAGTNELVFQNYITINDVPEAGFSSQHDQTMISFENSSVDATAYVWDFGDGSTSEEEHPLHIYDDEGEYTVSLTAINNCGETTITQTISVTKRPTASFAVNNSAGCAPIEVQYLDASSSNVENWEWEFPGGTPASSFEQNPVVTYNAPGIYSATLYVSGAGGNDTIALEQVVEAYGLPTTEILSNVELNEVQFNSTNTDVLAYDWDFGDGEISDLEAPSHIFPENGTYLVLLTITDECGSTTVETEVTINAYATSAFVADNDSGCPPFTVEFSQDATMAESFLWSFPGGEPAMSTEEVVSVSYDEPGTYPVSLVASNSIGEDEISIESFITVGSLPVAEFDLNILDDLIELTDMSQDATEYQWDFGDGTISNISNPNHVYDESGEYTVTLTVFNDCGESSTSRNIVVDVPGAAVVNSLEIYPNPNDGNFTAEIDAEGVGDFDYSIVDMLDRLVYKGKITVRGSQNKYPLSHSDLAPATYILKLENENQKFTLKMIVQ